MTNSLEQYVEGWSPEPLTETDEIDRERAGWVGDLLDASELAAADRLPPLWHWCWFGGWPAYGGLADDGHPVEGHFQPRLPQRRRMWAGGRVVVEQPLSYGPVERRSSLVSVVPKSGRTGEMLLVTVRYEYLQDGVRCLDERQNHVYRSGDGDGPRGFGDRPTEPVTADAPWRFDIHTDSVRLFRMSAITGNSHRIHYDLPYAQEVEGYPGLVVHGPLLAMHVGTLAARHEPGWELASIDYRVQAPVFAGEPVSAIGYPAAGDEGPVAELAVRSHPDTTHVAASATYREIH